MEIIAIDDEVAALETFLHNIVDNYKVNCKMFQSEPFAALEYAKTTDLDAAFLDINMPKINGIELAVRLTEINPRIKIVFISAYKQNEKEIMARLGDNFLGFCYKPYDKSKIQRILAELERHSDKKPKFYFKTFGCFDLFISGMPVHFSSAKSKELLALLVDRRGAYLHVGEAAAFLWPEKNAETAKSLYRDIAYRLRMTLREHNVQNIIINQRGKCALDIKSVDCDCWDFIDGKAENYTGSYMPMYDWSISMQTHLDIMLDSRKKINKAEIN